MSRGGPRYSEAQARVAIGQSFSYAEALRMLGMRAAGGNSKTLKRYATEIWHITVDHFDPRHHQRAPFSRRHPATPLEDLLVEGCHYNRGRLKARLFESGLKQRLCEMCEQAEIWRGRRMSLILDHVNGHATDNRIENLRIVCPNCAATLETHCGRNKKLARTCVVCRQTFRPGTPTQMHCTQRCGGRSEAARSAALATRRVERPPHERLVQEIAETNWSAVGRKYGVSDNAVRKWIRFYEMDTARAQFDNATRRTP